MSTGGDHRSFFSFDLSSISEVVLDATLLLTRGTSSSNNEATETLEFFDVSTNAATLNNNTGGNAAIYADLGSGTSYGAFNIAGSGSLTDILSFNLNASALTDINAASGFFSIGGIMTSDDGFDGVFGGSQVYTAELRLETRDASVTEPGTLGLLMLGAMGAASVRRRVRDKA